MLRAFIFHYIPSWCLVRSQETDARLMLVYFFSTFWQTYHTFKPTSFNFVLIVLIMLNLTYFQFLRYLSSLFREAVEWFSPELDAQCSCDDLWASVASCVLSSVNCNNYCPSHSWVFSPELYVSILGSDITYFVILIWACL